MADLAHAQMDGGRGRRNGSPGTGRDMAGPDHDMPTVAADPGDQADMLLDELFDALQLAPQQAAPWQAYANRVRLAVQDRRRWRGRARASDTTILAPEASERQLDEARNRLTALEDIAAAGQAFYEGLDTRQKTIADRQMPVLIGTLAGTIISTPSGGDGGRGRQAGQHGGPPVPLHPESSEHDSAVQAPPQPGQAD